MNNKNEIKTIEIYDGDSVFYGANQYWYKKKLSAISGCGPTTASVAMAYLAAQNDACRNLYPYDMPFKKDEFLDYMEDVRLAIKPKFGPMTDPDDFCQKCVDYAKDKSVDISYEVMDKSQTTDEVFEKIAQLVDNGILPALLILRNPHKEIDEYTWHWMTVTGYVRDKKELIIATYGTRVKMDFTKAWNNNRPYVTDVVWFLCR